MTTATEEILETSSSVALDEAVIRRRTVVQGALSVLGALGFVAVWAYYATFVFEPFVLPQPWAVVQRMWQLLAEGVVLANFWASLWKTMLGWLMALVVGLPIGLLMGRYRYAKAFFHDLVYLAANVPLIVYAVLMLIVFGISSIGRLLS